MMVRRNRQYAWRRRRRAQKPFIDTGNARAPAAQGGKAKQKRADLRLVGLGLVVTRDGGIPLLSYAYPGNKPDVTQFPEMITILAARHAALAAAAGQDGTEMTVVFDAGQNSEANFALLAGTKLRYVGSVPASDGRDLLAVPADARAVVDVDRFGQLTAYNTRRPRPKVEAEITKITLDAWVRRVITWELTGGYPRDLRLTWSIDAAGRAALEQEIFGKHVLITDHDDWTAAEVIAGYRSQSEAEFSFRQMKDPSAVSFSPMFHWTEHNIRVHILTCVLALQIAHLMRRRAQRAGRRVSVRELLTQLAGIGETILIYPARARRHDVHGPKSQLDRAVTGGRSPRVSRLIRPEEDVVPARHRRRSRSPRCSLMHADERA